MLPLPPIASSQPQAVTVATTSIVQQQPTTSGTIVVQQHQPPPPHVQQVGLLKIYIYMPDRSLFLYGLVELFPL